MSLVPPIGTTTTLREIWLSYAVVAFKPSTTESQQMDIEVDFYSGALAAIRMINAAHAVDDQTGKKMLASLEAEMAAQGLKIVKRKATQAARMRASE